MADTRTLTCASCSLPLRRLTSLTAVHSWICDACKSVAAEIGSLADSVPRERIIALEHALDEAAAGDRKCPKCQRAMKRAPVRGGDGMIEIDGCGSCRIAWFDRGELQSLQTTTVGGSTPVFSAMSPEERRVWRMVNLRKFATVEELRATATGVDDEQSAATIVGLVLGIPQPESVAGQSAAYMTWTICGLTTLASVLAFGNLRGSALRFGMVPAEVLTGHWAGLITHFFVHADVFHLLGNLAFFFVFGSRVEALIGRLRFGAVILLATIVGGLAHAEYAPDPTIPLIGASGGISGVLAAYIALRPKSKVRILIWYQVVRVPAWGFFAFWIALQVIGAGAQIAGASAVSALGHLGGGISGFLLAWPWRGRAAAVIAARPANPT